MKKYALVYSRLLVLLLVMGSFTTTLFSKSFLGQNGILNQVKSESLAKSNKKESKQKPETDHQVIVSTQSVVAFVTLPAPTFEAIFPDFQSVFFTLISTNSTQLRAQLHSVFQLCVHRNLFFTCIQRSAP